MSDRRPKAHCPCHLIVITANLICLRSIEEFDIKTMKLLLMCSPKKKKKTRIHNPCTGIDFHFCRVCMRSALHCLSRDMATTGLGHGWFSLIIVKTSGHIVYSCILTVYSFLQKICIRVVFVRSIMPSVDAGGSFRIIIHISTRYF